MADNPGFMHQGARKRMRTHPSLLRNDTFPRKRASDRTPVFRRAMGEGGHPFRWSIYLTFKWSSICVNPLARSRERVGVKGRQARSWRGA